MKLQAMKNWFARVGSVAVIGTVCGAIGGFGGYAALSYAAGQNLGGVNDYQIPYQGILELGGEPVDGPTEFIFTLYKSKDSVAPADKLWTSNPRTLQVSRGYFATVLGDESDLNNRLTSAIMAEKILYIGMKVDGVELAGRQRILAVPYAQNGAPGKNFVVDGRIQTVDLAVTNNATVTGKLNVQGTSALSGGVVGGLNVAGGATVNGGTTLNGGTILNSGATVNGQATLNNGLRVDGNLTTGGTANDNKLVQFEYFDGTSSGLFPGYLGPSTLTTFKASEWNCMIAGVKVFGDIDENGAGDILNAYTKIDGEFWRVYHSFKTHKDPPRFEVGVACFSTKVSNRRSWF